ncbi:uncharacterized protein TM35_000531230 [Trypanosoma theileri]|uniref:Uncharacterized protein n=1 Tax=Trypanosoma theileri TaxID=67003 RepID=A0A1X0NIC9_9TRYP|nr:uncharacterized protein TM35_000531230 [Trypanosoma theileri]ORC83939.1 hypothetical protein TM35_000531230 [Trypanosoma theileri]
MVTTLSPLFHMDVNSFPIKVLLVVLRVLRAQLVLIVLLLLPRLTPQPKELALTTPQELTSSTTKEPETGGADNTNAENANIPNNDEESNSTITTTTTTTLSPELTNNKKGDADSSSSISSSVWVRVPLLIVVTLACILVCCLWCCGVTQVILCFLFLFFAYIPTV